MNTYHRMAPSKTVTVAAVGEHAYKPTLRNVPEGIQWVELVPEPDNPHNNRAISIRYNGAVIAYIPRDRTKTYWPTVARIIASGKTPKVKAKIYHSKSGDFHEVSLFILSGDKGLGSTSGLIPKAANYEVPNAFIPEFSNTPKSKPKLSAPSPKFASKPKVSFTQRELEQEQLRRSVSAAGDTFTRDEDSYQREKRRLEENRAYHIEQRRSASNDKAITIGCAGLFLIALVVLVIMALP